MEQTDKLIDSTEVEHQTMFEQRFNALMNGFGEACESNKIDISIAIAIHPQEEKPLVFIRGDEYDVARLMAVVLRQLKHQVLRELDV
jgi:hypothetical protein